MDLTLGRIGEAVAGQDDCVAIGIGIARREDDIGPSDSDRTAGRDGNALRRRDRRPVINGEGNGRRIGAARCVLDQVVKAEAALLGEGVVQRDGSDIHLVRHGDVLKGHDKDTIAIVNLADHAPEDRPGRIIRQQIRNEEKFQTANGAAIGVIVGDCPPGLHGDGGVVALHPVGPVEMVVVKGEVAGERRAEGEFHHAVRKERRVGSLRGGLDRDIGDQRVGSRVEFRQEAIAVKLKVIGEERGKAHADRGRLERRGHAFGHCDGRAVVAKQRGQGRQRAWRPARCQLCGAEAKGDPFDAADQQILIGCTTIGNDVQGARDAIDDLRGVAKQIVLGKAAQYQNIIAFAAEHRILACRRASAGKNRVRAIAAGDEVTCAGGDDQIVAARVGAALLSVDIKIVVAGEMA